MHHRSSLPVRLSLLSLLVFALAVPACADSPLTVHLRTRKESKPGSGRFHATTQAAEWSSAKTAIVVCDMWNQHWCRGASARVAELAPRMNEVLKAARDRGVLIIHCPSNTMKFYDGTPQRKLAQAAPPIKTKLPLKDWCYLDSSREGQLPIDDKDGGCDCDPPCKQGSPWTRQIAALSIEAPDAITDSAEALYLMKQRGIENVIVMGVHTNMCVLGRPFGIRQLSAQGMNVVLMRDMTDTMYNSRSAPRVNHHTGTDLVVEHIERHWCPTISSVDFVGGSEFRFADDRRPRVAIVIAEPEYQTIRTLPEFAADQLRKEFRVTLLFGSETKKQEIQGLEALRDCDVMLLSVKRHALPKAQMKLLREFIASGKGVVGIRTASHAFSLRGKEAGVGRETWETFDPEVLGGRYTGHHGNGIESTITLADGTAESPLLLGVDVKNMKGHGSLYHVSPLVKGATPLLIGTIPDKPSEPIAWTFTRADGGRSFYTSLGHPGDFTDPAFRKLLFNALSWAATKER